MAYEIDFIGVGDRAADDADAICFRWTVGQDSFGEPIYKVGVFDGGFEAHGKEMVQTLNKYYFDDSNGTKESSQKVIDFVCVSHPDQDHTAGITQILENFTVKRIFMNRPWLYTDDLDEYLTDHRLNLAKQLREAFPYIAEIEDVANEKGIPIYEAFTGTLIEDCFRVLSPTKEFYLTLLVESYKTPLEGPISILEKGKHLIEAFFSKAKDAVLSLAETWTREELHEDVRTTAENESSIVLLATIDKSRFLLTGDAGIRALEMAIDYADSIGVSTKTDISFFQIPHHGGRHNVSPSILNRLLGNVLPENTSTDRTALASVAKNSRHPCRMVTNAFIRRGVQPFSSDDGATINYQHGDMPTRNWTSMASVPFTDYVEEWED